MFSDFPQRSVSKIFVRNYRIMNEMSHRSFSDRFLLRCSLTFYSIDNDVNYTRKTLSERSTLSSTLSIEVRANFKLEYIIIGRQFNCTCNGNILWC